MNNNILILPFDFEDRLLVEEAINILNSESKLNKHSIEFWNWRFEQNPFGPGLGWYAKDTQNNKLVGILLWWPWKYTCGEKEILFYQAINGKIDRNYRNTGIFFQLNSVSVKYFESKNIPLYGIPNDKSYSSYIKLGWETISEVHPFYIVLSPLNSIKKLFGFYKRVLRKTMALEFVPADFQTTEYFGEVLYTNWNKRRIEWRFLSHPIFKYHCFAINNNIIIYKLKQRHFFCEAQVVLSTILSNTEIKLFIRQLRKERVDFISYYGFNTKMEYFISKKILKFRLKKPLYFVCDKTMEVNKFSLRLELAEMDTQ
jgi:hypothetical protein